MANYCCTIRTNYFHVKDENAFRTFMSRVYGCEDDIELWEEKDKDGRAVFGFGVYGGISGIRDQIDKLQEFVADDDAVIILESGNEKMRYVVGSATIVTSSDYKYIDIEDIAVKQAGEMLHNPLWKTICDY